jgi:sulfur-oxidizing protein SoxY
MATPQALQAAIAAFTNGRTPRDGRVQLEISPLVENGNAVPVSVTVQSPMTAADHVQRIALLTSPRTRSRSGGVPPRARATDRHGRHRMRLATSQTVVAWRV